MSTRTERQRQVRAPRVKRKVAKTVLEAAKGAPLKEIGETIYAMRRANQEKNKHSREESKERKHLIELLNKDEIEVAEVALPDGGMVRIDYTEKEVESTSIDLEVLKRIATPAQFMACVSATQKAVTEQLGTAALAKCLVTTKSMSKTLEITDL